MFVENECQVSETWNVSGVSTKEVYHSFRPFHMGTCMGRSKIKVRESLVFVVTLLCMCRMNAIKHGSHFVDINL